MTGIRADIKDKASLALNGADAVAFYGSEFLPLGEHHISEIRTLTADAIFGPSSTRNSATALACTPRLVDPMLYVILSAICTARLYLLRCTPDIAAKFLKIASSHVDFRTSAGDPSVVLNFTV